MSNILLLADFPLSNKMAGPLLRSLELAQALRQNHDVTIAGTYTEKDFDSQGLSVIKMPAFLEINIGIKITLPNNAFLTEINKFDAIITHGRILSVFGLNKIKTKLILDMYAPWYLEDLVSGKTSSHKANMEQIKILLLRGDFLLCSTERQKDLLVGLALMAGRSEIDLQDKFGIVPIGISSIPPKQIKNTLKGVYPGINKDDKIVISWGGIWDWLDPETIVKAAQIITQKRSDIKFVFFGVSSSEKDKVISKAAKSTIELSKELGLFNKQIFFIEKWIPYQERANWLLDCDLGVISHHDNIETRYSWRTRALDYLWANLPIITTKGDAISEIVKSDNLGRVVPYQGHTHMAEAIIELVDNKSEYQTIKQNIKEYIPKLYWENLTFSIDRFLGSLSLRSS